jgi:hypothetical protein
MCARCGVGRARDGQGYCNACHAAYMRDWRPSHPLTDEQRRKDTARSYANVYKARGKLQMRPCENCASQHRIEMHHEDYSRPLAVKWLCRPCHVHLHHVGALPVPETERAA